MENMEPTFVRLSGLLFSTAHVNFFLDFKGDCGAGDDFIVFDGGFVIHGGFW